MRRGWILWALVALVGCTGCASTEAMSGNTLDRIKASKTVTFGYRESSVPFSFAREGKPAGYSVDLCNRVAADLKRDLQMPDLDVKWVAVTVENRVQTLRDKAIDLECGSTTNTLSRQADADFSLTTWVTGGSLLALRDVTFGDFQKLRIAVIPGTTTERVLKDALAKSSDIQWVPVKDHAEGRRAIETRAADAYASDRDILIGLALTAADPSRFALADRYFSYEPYALMLRRGDRDFRLAVDKSLARLFRSGEVLRVYDRWFGPIGPPGALLIATWAISGLPE
jgi:glutamate/aspartate transport system substrate-binding protein